MIHYNGVSYTQ